MSGTRHPVVAGQLMRSRNERMHGNEWKRGEGNGRKKESVQTPAEVKHALVLLFLSVFFLLLLRNFALSFLFEMCCAVEWMERFTKKLDEENVQHDKFD